MGSSHSAPAAPKTIVITDPGTKELHFSNPFARSKKNPTTDTTTTTVTTTDPYSAPTGVHNTIDQGTGTTLNFSNTLGSANTYVGTYTQQAGAVTNFGLILLL